MYLLLVDDEVGIREGMAAFLRLQGCRVQTAADRASAMDALAAGDFDAVVTDWHLPDGDAAPLLDVANGPVVAVSGVTEEIPDHPNVQAVLAKPLSPARLQETLRDVLTPKPRPAAEAAPVPREGSPASAAAASQGRLAQCIGPEPALAALPHPIRDLLDLMLTTLGADFGAITHCQDDGTLVTVEVTLPSPAVVPDPEGILERIGGDLQVTAEAPDSGGALGIRWRVYRDARPEPACRRVEASDTWPRTRQEVGAAGWFLDLAPEREASPARILQILRRLVALPLGIRPRAVLHGPPWTPLLAERFGLTGSLPKKPLPGPRLDSERSVLWSLGDTAPAHGTPAGAAAHDLIAEGNQP